MHHYLIQTPILMTLRCYHSIKVEIYKIHIYYQP